MWYEKIGFDDNPFELNPFKIDFKLVNRKSEADELLYRIEAGSMMLIEGKNGKTALLKHAIDNFKGKGKVIYVDGNKLSKRLDIESLLVKRSGLVKGGLLRKKPKGMILLFDNVQQLTKKNCEKIKYYFDQDYLKSVVFTTNNYKNVDFTPSLRDRIGERVIKLSNLVEEDAIQIIKDRIKEHLDEEIIKEIYKNSNKNLKKFLTNCSFILEHKIEKGEIKKEDIKNILKEKEYKEAEPQTNICPDCKDELEKIKEHWRCKNCDVYCKNCGALVDIKDVECPECGIKFEEEKEEKKKEVDIKFEEEEKEIEEVKKEIKEKKRRKEEKRKRKEERRKEEKEKEKEKTKRGKER